MLTESYSQPLTFASSKGSVKMRMSTPRAKMDRPFTAGQLNPSLFSTARKGFFFYVEKVLTEVISTEEEIVCTHEMHFYHRSLCKPIYIAFWVIFHKILLQSVSTKSDRDFTMSFKMSVKNKLFFLAEKSHHAVSSQIDSSLLMV